MSQEVARQRIIMQTFQMYFLLVVPWKILQNTFLCIYPKKASRYSFSFNISLFMTFHQKMFQVCNPMAYLLCPEHAQISPILP